MNEFIVVKVKPVDSYESHMTDNIFFLRDIRGAKRYEDRAVIYIERSGVVHPLETAISFDRVVALMQMEQERK